MSETTVGIKSPVPQAPMDEFHRLLNYLRSANGTTEMEYQEFRERLDLFLDQAEVLNTKFLEFALFTEAFLKRHFPER